MAFRARFGDPFLLFMNETYTLSRETPQEYVKKTTHLGADFIRRDPTYSFH